MRLEYRYWVHWTIAELLYAAGAPRAANNHVRAASKLVAAAAPESPRVASLHGLGKLSLQNGHVHTARRLLLDALALPSAQSSEDLPHIYTKLLIAEWELRENEAFETHLSTAVRLFPDEPVFSQIVADRGAGEPPPVHLAEETENPRPAACAVCGSSFGDIVCSNCGADLVNAVEDCPWCGHDGFMPLGALAAVFPFRCPVCLGNNHAVTTAKEGTDD